MATWQSTENTWRTALSKPSGPPFGFNVIAGGVLAVARGLQLYVNPLKVRAFATMYGFRRNPVKLETIPGSVMSAKIVVPHDTL